MVGVSLARTKRKRSRFAAIAFAATRVAIALYGTPSASGSGGSSFFTRERPSPAHSEERYEIPMVRALGAAAGCADIAATGALTPNAGYRVVSWAARRDGRSTDPTGRLGDLEANAPRSLAHGLPSSTTSMQATDNCRSGAASSIGRRRHRHRCIGGSPSDHRSLKGRVKPSSRCFFTDAGAARGPIVAIPHARCWSKAATGSAATLPTARRGKAAAPSCHWRDARVGPLTVRALVRETAAYGR
jgi:hypothetical protein